MFGSGELVWVRCPQYGNLSIINWPFVMVSKQKWHVSSCSAGGLNRLNSAMIVGDKTSSASPRVLMCSMFSDEWCCCKISCEISEISCQISHKISCQISREISREILH